MDFACVGEFFKLLGDMNIEELNDAFINLQSEMRDYHKDLQLKHNEGALYAKITVLFAAKGHKLKNGAGGIVGAMAFKLKLWVGS